MEISQKEKNGKISMEAKIVGAEYALPQCMWSRYFVEGQGYTVEELKFRQDNMSDILMENNGKNQAQSGQITSKCDTSL